MVNNLELVDEGRKAIASSFKDKADSSYLGLGKFPVGYPDTWTDPAPIVSEVTDPDLIDEFGVQATELLEEVGRRKASLVDYCEPDVLGDILVNGTTYKLSTTTTKYLYYKFILDPSDGGSEEICQRALFIDVVPLGSVPPGQYWLIPSELDDPGIMWQLQNVVPANLDPLKKGFYEVVQEF